MEWLKRKLVEGLEWAASVAEGKALVEMGKLLRMCDQVVAAMQRQRDKLSPDMLQELERLERMQARAWQEFREGLERARQNLVRRAATRHEDPALPREPPN